MGSKDGLWLKTKIGLSPRLAVPISMRLPNWISTRPFEQVLKEFALQNTPVSKRSKFGSTPATLGLLVLGFSILAAGQSGSAGQRRRTKNVAIPPVVQMPMQVAPLPVPDPRPITPEELTPMAPQVVWDGEQLAISTDNSTLGSILDAVRTSTGADIDVPPAARQERVAAHLGPASAREVLSQLLSGTDFDYVIQAADDNAMGVQSVLLSPRSKSTSGSAPARAAMASQYQRESYRRAAAAPNPEPSEQSNPASVDVAASLATESGTQTAAAAQTPTDPAKSTSLQPENTAPAPDASPAEAVTAQANLPAAASSETDGKPQGMLNQKIADMQSLFQQRRAMQEEVLKGKASN